jgi:hypothetical protein
LTPHPCIWVHRRCPWAKGGTASITGSVAAVNKRALVTTIVACVPHNYKLRLVAPSEKSFDVERLGSASILCRSGHSHPSRQSSVQRHMWLSEDEPRPRLTPGMTSYCDPDGADRALLSKSGCLVVELNTTPPWPQSTGPHTCPACEGRHRPDLQREEVRYSAESML